ncbi:MAG TPA: tellurite resistance TerB family protein [Hyphomonadaceae bacterium]|nr:tellurite resistance TerB family protein [Hyphomonadaceae bacterium]
MANDVTPITNIANIFQAPPERPASSFNFEKLAADFGKSRNTDWTVGESFLCLLLTAVSVDGVFSREEQEEVKALLMRSRALKSMNQTQLAQANTVIQKRLAERKDGLEEACLALPSEMRLSAFAHCVDIILSDGNLAPAEADYLNRITGFLALTPEDAKRIMEVLLIKNRF